MAELPQRTSALVDIVGSNSPRVQVQTLQGSKTPLQEDITDQKLSESRQAVAKMYADTAQGLTDVASAKASDLSRKGRSGGAAELSGLVDSITTGIKVYADVNAAKAKAKSEAEAEALKTSRTLANQTVRSAVQSKVSELNNAINTRAGADGINKLNLDLDQILAENRASLSPEDYQQIEDLVMSQRNQASDEYYTRLFNTQDESDKQERAARLATLTLKLSPMLGALRTARTQEEYQQGITTILDGAMADTAEMTPEQRSVFLTPLLNQLATDSQSSAATVIGIQQTQQDIQSALPAVASCDSKYGNDPNALSACYAQVQNAYPGAAALINSHQTPSEIRSSALDDITTQAKLQQLAVTSQDADMQRLNGDYRNAAVNSLAFKLSQGGQMAAERERIRNSTTATPQEKEALALAESWDKDRETFNTLNERYLAGNTALESLAVKVDPTRLGDDTYMAAFRDPITGQVSPPVRVAGGAFIIRPTASRAEFDAKVAEVNEIARQRDELIFSRQQQGFNLSNPRDGTFQAPINAVLERGRAEAAAATNTPTLQTRIGSPELLRPPNRLPGAPNFNRVDGQGRIPSQPIVPLRRLIDGRNGDAQTNMISPISGVSAVITDGYGDSGNGENQHHSSFHTGIDIGSDERGDVPLRALTGGTVLHVDDWSGFGGTVTIRSPTGHVEQYSHMRSFDVKPGQQIAPGTTIGLMGGGEGDPMSGGSTGRHVHLTIYRPDVKDDEVGYNVSETSIDPRQYLAGLQYGNANYNTQQGLPPNQANAEDAPRNSYVQIPRSAIILPQGFAFSGNNIQGSVFTNAQMEVLGLPNGSRDPGPPGVPIQNVATPATPQIGGMMPINRNSYPSIGTKNDNYGYQELRDRPKLREAINLVARTLDVPGMWVADIMNAESGFRHTVGGGDGGNYKGLIQINPDWLAQNGISWADIDSRDEVWQAQNIVIPYFKQVLAEQGSPSRYNSIEDMYAAIQGGGRMLRLSPQERTYGDSNAAFPEHMRNMGSAAGRRYRTTWEQASLFSQPTQELQDGEMPRTNGTWSVVG